MNNSIRWLAGLCLEKGYCTSAECRQALDAAGPEANVHTYAQHLLASGIVTDREQLEKFAHYAHSQLDGPPPPVDPLANEHEDAKAEPAPEPVPTTVASPPPAPSAVDVQTATPLTSIDFDFAGVSALDDATLADRMRDLLRATARFGASDLHLSTAARPFVRKHRDLVYLTDYALTNQDALRLNLVLLSEGQKTTFLELKDYDYALALSDSERYRVNLMFHKDGSAGAYRIVAPQTKTIAELGFTDHVATIDQLLSYHNGLILITGPVGSGKTTTLASMVAQLNETRSDHIITVEDPIEVVQAPRGCNVSQREVGPHTRSFFSALKGALREDPDIIVIGELRDLETIEMAISASETGHLVIGTMHTADAVTTLNRILDVFPPGQQPQIRASVAESLRGVVCQRLLPATDGGLALACEILISNPAVQNLVREGKTQGVRNTMETGARDGMCLMDNVVFNLWQAKTISNETALANINNRMIRARVA